MGKEVAFLVGKAARCKGKNNQPRVGRTWRHPGCLQIGSAFGGGAVAQGLQSHFRMVIIYDNFMILWRARHREMSGFCSQCVLHPSVAQWDCVLPRMFAWTLPSAWNSFPLDQLYSIELSGRMEMFCWPSLSSIAATSKMWVLHIWNAASVTEE